MSIAGDVIVDWCPYEPDLSGGFGPLLKVPESALRGLKPDERWICRHAAGCPRESAAALIEWGLELHPDDPDLVRPTAEIFGRAARYAAELRGHWPTIRAMWLEDLAKPAEFV